MGENRKTMSSNPLLPEELVENPDHCSRFFSAFVTRIVTGIHIRQPGFSLRITHESRSLIIQVTYGELRSTREWLYAEISSYQNPEAIAQRAAHAMLVEVGAL